MFAMRYLCFLEGTVKVRFFISPVAVTVFRLGCDKHLAAFIVDKPTVSKF